MDFSASSIDAALELLPGWSRWLPGLADLFIAWGLTRLLSWLTSRVGGSVRRTEGEGWTELARRAWNPRTGPQLACMTVMAAFLVRSYTREHEIDLWPDWLHRLLIVMAVETAIVQAGWRIERALRGEWITRARYLRSALSMRVVYYSPIYVGLLFGLSVPGGATPFAWALGVTGGVLVMAFALGAALPLAHAMGALRPAGERLKRITAESARRAGLREPRVWLMSSVMPNAFAFHTVGAVAFSDRATEVLTDEQLGAIADHELGHLAEPARVRWGRRCAVVPFAVLVSARPIYEAFGLGVLLVVFGASLVVMSVVGRKSMQWEEHADEAAHRHDHAHDEGRYARALYALHEDGLLPVVMPGKRPSHPHLYDRMQKAGVEPGFPRPDPPSSGRRLAMTFATVLPLVAVVIGLVHLDTGSGLQRLDPDLGDAWALAALGPRAASFGRLAGRRWEGGRLEEARVFYEAAGAIDRWSVWIPAALARLELAAGEPERARQALMAAERRVGKQGGEDRLSAFDLAELENARGMVGAGDVGPTSRGR